MWEIVAANQLSWTVGAKGKGYVLQDGSVHTWNVDDEGNPHHKQEYDRRGILSPLTFLFNVDPNGAVHEGGIGYSNRTGKPDQAVISYIVDEDPRLHDGVVDGGGGFDDDLLDSIYGENPDGDPGYYYNQPIGRDADFGHANRIMDILSSVHNDFVGELKDWLKGFESPSDQVSTQHHDNIDQILPQPNVSPRSHDEYSYPPGHEPDWYKQVVARAKEGHTINHVVGQPGRGLVTPEGDVHTWPEDWGTHGAYASAVLGWATPYSSFYIDNDGRPREEGGYRIPPDHRPTVEQVLGPINPSRDVYAGHGGPTKMPDIPQELFEWMANNASFDHAPVTAAVDWSKVELEPAPIMEEPTPEPEAVPEEEPVAVELYPTEPVVAHREPETVHLPEPQVIVVENSEANNLKETVASLADVVAKLSDREGNKPSERRKLIVRRDTQGRISSIEEELPEEQ